MLATLPLFAPQGPVQAALVPPVRFNALPVPTPEPVAPCRSLSVLARAAPKPAYRLRLTFAPPLLVSLTVVVPESSNANRSLVVGTGSALALACDESGPS